MWQKAEGVLQYFKVADEYSQCSSCEWLCKTENQCRLLGLLCACFGAWRFVVRLSHLNGNLDFDVELTKKKLELLHVIIFVCGGFPIPQIFIIAVHPLVCVRYCGPSLAACKDAKSKLCAKKFYRAKRIRPEDYAECLKRSVFGCYVWGFVVALWKLFSTAQKYVGFLSS